MRRPASMPPWRTSSRRPSLPAPPRRAGGFRESSIGSCSVSSKRSRARVPRTRDAILEALDSARKSIDARHGHADHRGGSRAPHRSAPRQSRGRDPPPFAWRARCRKGPSRTASPRRSRWPPTMTTGGGLDAFTDESKKTLLFRAARIYEGANEKAKRRGRCTSASWGSIPPTTSPPTRSAADPQIARQVRGGRGDAPRAHRASRDGRRKGPRHGRDRPHLCAASSTTGRRRSSPTRRRSARTRRTTRTPTRSSGSPAAT